MTTKIKMLIGLIAFIIIIGLGTSMALRNTNEVPEQTPNVSTTPTTTTTITTTTTQTPSTPTTNTTPTQTPTTPTTQTPTTPTTPVVSAPVEASYTRTEIAVHNSKTNCWTFMNGKVYDITSYVPRHPGGERNILKICGKDGTALFEDQHGGDKKPQNILESFYIGYVRE